MSGAEEVNDNANGEVPQSEQNALSNSRKGEKSEENKEESVTVFMDPSNFNVKHPLQNRWTMWYDNPGKKTSQASWGDHLRQIATFDTVEDFWRLFNNIQPPSGLLQGSNYHLFKEGIEPKWEDKRNSRGGKWVFSLPNKRREDIDKLWLWTVLALIGESFTEEDEVCGAVVSTRKGADKIAVWTADLNDGVTIQIGRQLKNVLEIKDSDPLGFQSHSDCMRRGSSFNNACKYTV